MNKYISPKKIGLDLERLSDRISVANSHGLTIDQLDSFIQAFGSTETAPVNVHEFFGIKAKERQVRTPGYIQSLLDEHGKDGAARIMGIGRGTLNNYISQMGLDAGQRSRDTPTRDELEPLLAEYTLADIAEIYSVSSQTVSGWVRRHGLKTRRARELEAKKKMKSIIYSHAQKIAEETGVSVESVTRNL